MRKHSWQTELAVQVVSAAMVISSLPVEAVEVQKPSPSTTQPATPATPPPAPKVKVNRTAPRVKPVPAYPVFSATPTREEIFRARVFSEPLVPVGGEPTDEDNRALAAALNTYLARGNDDGIEPLEHALKNRSQSRWRPSLIANLGVIYQKRGYFTRGMGILREAFDLTQEEEEPLARAVADQALGSLLDSYLSFGKLAELDQLLEEIEGRDVRGSATEKVAMAKEGAWILRNAHESAVASGPMSVERILIHTRRDYKGDPAIKALHADADGTSLAEVADLSARVGLNLQMVFREDDLEVPLPAIVHFKAGHFAALIKKEGSRYLIDDPILGGDIWVTRAALNDETTGYFLLRPGPLPAGWRPADPEEAARIRGKCKPEFGPPTYLGGCDQQNGGAAGDGCSGGACPGGGGGSAGSGGSGSSSSGGSGGSSGSGGSGGGGSWGHGMAVYSFHSLLASLHLTDTPVGYSPPRGPSARFTVNYNHREAMQPQIFTYSNLGAKWTFDWISFVEDDPANPNASVSVYKRGAGGETYSDATGTVPNTDSQALLVRTSTSPIRYERRLADGSVETFTQPDAAMAFPRRVFMTEARDPQGNSLNFTYDASLRLVAVTDAIGQVTTLVYEHSSDPLKITRVTDPFGRSALFEYDGSDRLTKITDVIGITSQFEYGPGNFIRALTTPYGTTTFTAGQYVEQLGLLMYRWIEATDPLGGKEKLQYFYQVTSLPTTLPAQVPQGFVTHTDLNRRLTLYWGKRAMALYPDDPTKAHAYHWLYSNDPGTLGQKISSTLGGEKAPLENWVFYDYTGSPLADSVGPDGKPSKVGRVLDDGTSQIYRYEYESQTGNKTRETDPVGRTTTYTYTANGIDLLEVRQVNDQTTDLLLSRTYNTQHLPLTQTDAARQTTTFTYNSQGQVLTMTTPPRAGITEERTKTYAYDTDGYLQSVTDPATGATTAYDYDGYARVRTVTDSDSYTLSYDYDVLDRSTRLTYPDGTYEETVYNRLDPEKQRDRLGQWSHTFHDALRRPVSARDPLGRITTIQWCTCGSVDKLIDPNGNATTWEWDLQGRVTRETRADGSFWEVIYETTTSRIKKRKDAKGQERQYTYLLDDKVQQTSYPNAQITTHSVSFTYDAAYGRVATMVDGTGTTSYTYHPVTATPPLGAGALASIDGPYANDTITYGYDELGRVVSRTLNGVTTTWSYDVLGRLAAVGDPVGNFTFSFVGTTGRLGSLTYPNGQITTYAYLPNAGDKHLQEIHHRVSASGTTLSKLTYAYDAVGNITLWTQQYGTSAANAYDLKYDAADQLGSAVHRTTDPTPVTLQRYGYAYDYAGNRATEQIDDAPMQSIHDTRNRLMSQQPGGALLFKGSVNEAAAVTLAGKPATVGADNKFQGTASVPAGTSNVAVIATDPAGNVRTSTYQVTPAGSSKTFTYDANGSLTAAGTKTYEWDGANRLVRVLDNGNEVARFVYDSNDRRSQKITGGVTRTYIYDGDDILEERPSVGATIRYVHGPGIDQPFANVESGAPNYYLADHLGSVLQMTNASGTVTLTRRYDPWGNLLLAADAAGYAFTGREWDPETGFYYYRARYYDPRLGRFLSEDGRRSSGSPYSYVLNHPTGLVDPSGDVAAPASVPAPTTHIVPPSQIVQQCGSHAGGCTILSVIPDCKCTKDCGSNKYVANFTVTITGHNIFAQNEGCPSTSTVLAHEGKHAQINQQNWSSAIQYLEKIERRTFDTPETCQAWCELAKGHFLQMMRKGQGGPWHYLDRIIMKVRCAFD